MTLFLMILQLMATAWMTAVIWITQRITYPGFADWPRACFVERHASYVRRIGPIVMPMMLLELATAIAWLATAPDNSRTLPLTGLALIVVIWISTFTLQVPCHNRLAAGFDPVLHRRLVNTNWIRTVGWSGRLLLLVYAFVGIGRVHP